MKNEISGKDHSGAEATYRVGDRVVVHVGVGHPTAGEDGTFVDEVVTCFVNETLLRPYAENTFAPAVGLKKVSWVPLASVEHAA